MKEKFPTFYKITKIPRWLFKNWIRITEIIVVIWAVNGILSEYSIRKGIYHITPVLAYFLSAFLILYLLRKYERNN